MRIVYQIVSLLLASALLCGCSGLESREEGFPNEVPNGDEKSMDGRRPLSVQIKAEVIPAAEETTDHQYEERLSAFLVDTWWKLTIWIVALVALTLVFCYITRCCYLVWDCCTDSYWGCCPKREGCKRFMLLKCCDSDCGFGRGVKYEYEICRNKVDCDADPAVTQNVGGSGTFQRSSRQANIASSGSSEMDFTLKNVEDVLGSNRTYNKDKLNVNTRWKDTSLTILSSMGEAQVSKAKSRIKSAVTRNSQYSVEQGMETAEALPQFRDGEYFNFLNVFGLGGAKCEYSMISSNGTDFTSGQVRKGSGKQSLGHCIKQKKGSAAQDEGNKTSRISPLHESYPVVQNNSDFLTSNSFSNGSYQRYGLNIEEGRRGKYHPLPEAQSELLPPDKFVQLQKDYPLGKYTSHDDKKALMASRRRSRSMETFTKYQNNPDELGCRRTGHETSQKLQRRPDAARSHIDVMVHQNQRNGIAILGEPADGLSQKEDHSHSCEAIQQVADTQPSDTDFALYSVPNKKRHDQEQCNGNTADETLPVSHSKPVIVPTFLAADASQFSSLPGKGSGGILHSAKGRRLIDSDMEKHILFGRETTL